MGKLIKIQALEARIKRKLRAHLKELGFVKTKTGLILPNRETKDHFRRLHRFQRKDKLENDAKFIEKNWPLLNKYFADGKKIVPEGISPRIEVVVSKTMESELFRLACLTWSVPVSQGYGRRMRFLVWDDYHEKLMGIFALGDPVFNLKARDEFIGWDLKDRKKRLVNIMDAYILGALPPYNMILGGKLIASIIRTKEVRTFFADKYGDSEGIISKKKKKPSLVLVSTSSALGRSSIYNRLKLDGIKYFEPIGFTSGWGHFHISDSLFKDMRYYLQKKKHHYASNHQFGDGPNWRLRTIPACRNIIVEEVAELAKDRGVLPRAKRRKEFRAWKAGKIKQLLNPNKNGSASLIRGPKKLREKVSGK